MNTQLTPIQSLTRDMAKNETSLATMLPDGMSAKRFMRTAINAITTHAQSAKLLQADRKSLFNSCQKAAADGLQIDGKEATLVTFFDKKLGCNMVQYMPMVQGLVKLARNSGKIKKITAQVVRANDEFSYNPSADSEPSFIVDWFEQNGSRGKAIGAYAVIKLADGENIVTIMPESRIQKIGSGGMNGYQYNQEKGAHFEEWWKKTVIKNALKYAPKSTELEMALANDDAEFQKNDSETVDTSTGEIIENDLEAPITIENTPTNNDSDFPL